MKILFELCIMRWVMVHRWIALGNPNRMLSHEICTVRTWTNGTQATTPLPLRFLACRKNSSTSRNAISSIFFYKIIIVIVLCFPSTLTMIPVGNPRLSLWSQNSSEETNVRKRNKSRFSDIGKKGIYAAVSQRAGQRSGRHGAEAIRA